MQISIAYSSPNGERSWIELDVAEGTSAGQAIQHSGFMQRFPELDLSVQKIGIFGKVVKPAEVLSEFDRVEIYRPITADPQLVPRRQTEGGDD